jgi:hypothetical protein
MVGLRAVLEHRNKTVHANLGLLLDMLSKAVLPVEAEPYRDKLVEIVTDQKNIAERNLVYLRLNRDDLLEDILSWTRALMANAREIIHRLTAPVLRARESDRLTLLIVGWMHAVHPETSGVPPAFADGSVGVLPYTGIPPIYFFPCIEQRGLLYQPLLFHEGGHVLYSRHAPEMDALVGELQSAIADELMPMSRRNDKHFEAVQSPDVQVIVDTWYMWAQELFCDAVGFTIGGPCFLEAFAYFLSSISRGDYYRLPGKLAGSTHPIMWLRIEMLLERASQAGFRELADRLRAEWRIMARSLRVVEDYHGYYSDSIGMVARRIIEDMLVEASPRPFTEEDAQDGGWTPSVDTPVRLLNWAWQVYHDDPAGYPTWESKQIGQFLGTP